MPRKIAVSVLPVLLGLGALLFLGYRQLHRGGDAAPPGFVPPPATVSASVVEELVWDQQLHAVGRLRAARGVNVSAEVGGIVRSIAFAPGAEVAAGAVMVELEASVEQANLQSELAQLRLAKINFDRDERLSGTDSISQTQLDKSRAEYDDAAARVERTRALIRQKSVRAPFSGQVGISEINIGEYIDAGEPIVSLQDLDTLFIDFSIPERFLPMVAEGQSLGCRVGAYPGEVLRGVVSAIDVESDIETHSVRVRATLDNRDGRLIPGMFAEVELVAGEPQRVLAVPRSAVSFSLYGDSVFVIQPAQEQPGQLVAVRRGVVPGALEREELVSISEGLQKGEQVVTAGQLKLRSGAPVAVSNSIADRE